MTAEQRERLRMKADIFKALGNPVRLGIVEILNDCEMKVSDITARVGTDISNVSKHLSLLRRLGIVSDRREGLKVFYSLTMPCVMDFSGCMERVLLDGLEDRRSVICGCGAATSTG